MGAAGAALAEHPGVDKIAFTGSSEVGKEIHRTTADTLKRVSLELGGKSPNIVFADADLDAAVPGAAMAVFANSGQICSAGTRLYVQRPIYDEFVQRVAAFAKTLRVGNALDPETQLGPLVSSAQLDRVIGYLALGKEQGARAAAGGAHRRRCAGAAISPRPCCRCARRHAHRARGRSSARSSGAALSTASTTRSGGNFTAWAAASDARPEHRAPRRQGFAPAVWSTATR
jgi:hypothetical protein